MKVFVAMSGGVDSSVAAALLKEQGHEVTGVTMRLTDEMSSEAAAAASGILGIPHRVVDFRKEFNDTVIKAFAGAYSRGLTPNPCVICNFEIKFGALLDYVLANGADALATGHYARVVSGDRAFKLLKGVDETKDQSYFLWMLTQERLAKTLFPLGEMTKEQVRKKARSLGLPQADSGESQDVCFVPDGDYQAYLERIPGWHPEPGPIVDAEGRVIGQHQGIHTVTVGQRKGMGIAAREPLYVLDIDAAANMVTAGPKKKAYSEQIETESTSWIKGRPPAARFGAEVKIRYNSPAVPATVIKNSAGIDVLFAEPQFAPAPGQSVVFYDGRELLGGAVILGEKK